MSNTLISLPHRTLTYASNFLSWIDSFSLSRTSKKIIFKRKSLKEIIFERLTKQVPNDISTIFTNCNLIGSFLISCIYGVKFENGNIDFFTYEELIEGSILAKKYMYDMRDRESKCIQFHQITEDDKKLTIDTKNFMDKNTDISVCHMFFDGEKLHYKNMHHLIDRMFSVKISKQSTVSFRHFTDNGVSYVPGLTLDYPFNFTTRIYRYETVFKLKMINITEANKKLGVIQKNKRKKTLKDRHGVWYYLKFMFCRDVYLKGL